MSTAARGQQLFIAFAASRGKQKMGGGRTPLARISSVIQYRTIHGMAYRGIHRGKGEGQPLELLHSLLFYLADVQSKCHSSVTPTHTPTQKREVQASTGRGGVGAGGGHEGPQ